MQTCLVYQLGQMPYLEAWRLQDQMAVKIAEGRQPPTLLLLEHPNVYSFGKQGNQANLLWGPQKLAQMGIELQWSDRGGDVTYHGPGQLVGYPLLPLRKAGQIQHTPDGSPRLPEMDYVSYLRKLEKVLINTLFGFGIGGGQIAGQTGVWVQGDVPSRCVHCPPDLFKQAAKIASIGVRVDALGISRHGFALNVSPDMTYWEGILACGLENQNKASMHFFLDPCPSVEIVAEALVQAFAEVFAYQMKPGPSLMA